MALNVLVAVPAWLLGNPNGGYVSNNEVQSWAVRVGICLFTIAAIGTAEASYRRRLGLGLLLGSVLAVLLDAAFVYVFSALQAFGYV